jgi:hypothetical protein
VANKLFTDLRSTFPLFISEIRLQVQEDERFGFGPWSSFFMNGCRGGFQSWEMYGTRSMIPDLQVGLEEVYFN